MGRNPETVRRWIREGKLRARKVGTQEHTDTLPVPPEWQATFWGGPMPDWVAIIRQQRTEH